MFVFWNPDRGVRMQGEYEERPDGTLRSTRPIPGGRGSSLFPLCQNMMLAAHTLGVSSLFTTFFGLCTAEVKELLHVPPRMFLESAVFLGYAAEPLGKAKRKPLAEVAHLDDWETPYADHPADRLGSTTTWSSPPTCGTSRLPAKYRDAGPRVRPGPDGRDDVPPAAGRATRWARPTGPLVDWWLYEDLASGPTPASAPAAGLARRGGADGAA